MPVPHMARAMAAMSAMRATRADGRIHAAKRDGYSACECAFQFEIKLRSMLGDAEEAVLLRGGFRHGDAACIYRDGSLNFHLDRRSYVQPYVAAALQAEPMRCRRPRPRRLRRAHRSGLRWPSLLPSRRPWCRTHRLWLRLRLFSSVAILLNRPFRIFHRFVVRPGVFSTDPGSITVYPLG